MNTELREHAEKFVKAGEDFIKWMVGYMESKGLQKTEIEWRMGDLMDDIKRMREEIDEYDKLISDGG